MKINVASFGGRSHLLDIARELAKQGHDVKFYSYTPTFFAKKFGLLPRNNSKFWILTLPFIIISRCIGFTPKLLYRYRCIYDCILAVYMRKCDVFIGQVPMQVVSSRVAKKRGALVIIESGLSHIVEYNHYLNKFGIQQGELIGTQRYHKCYNSADYITVASEFVQNGFVKNRINLNRLFVNPYGVSFDFFQPTILSDNPFDIIIVGQWSKRKGSNLIIEAARDLNLKVLHVGKIADVEFPDQSNFTHIDAVPESELKNYYQQAKIFLFPSYEDGFGLVLIQALICGLPIVCSKHTGGPTLRKMITDKKWIVEMDNINTTSLKIAIEKAMQLAVTQIGYRNYVTEKDLQQISWDAYGKRYNQFILSHK